MIEVFVGFDWMEEIMNMELEDDIFVCIIELEDIKGDIKFEDVFFFYIEDKEVVYNISFDVFKGFVIVLVGFFGLGKLIIVGLVVIFFILDSGLIMVDGIDFLKVSLDSF